MSAAGPLEEVVVTLDGLPRPAVVVTRDGNRVLVRFRQAGAFEERWVPAAAVVPVEASATTGLPLVKLVGLLVVGVLGLVLLLWPGGSDKPLLGPSPSPSATPSASPSPSPSASASPGVVHAVLFGDSLTAGKNDPAGTRTALVVAAAALHWQYVVHAQPSTGWTTTPSYAERLAREVTTAPDVLLLQGGASDTGASATALRRAVTTTVTALRRRFPRTVLVLVGPVAMEQPRDQSLVRVSAALASACGELHVTYVDPIPWITAANAQQYLSPQGFYPNPAGHAYLGARLAAVLRSLPVEAS